MDGIEYANPVPFPLPDLGSVFFLLRPMISGFLSLELSASLPSACVWNFSLETLLTSVHLYSSCQQTKDDKFATTKLPKVPVSQFNINKMRFLSRIFGKENKRKKQVLSLELTLTDLELGKGTKHHRGRYHPFCQITNEDGYVLGRSIVLFDCRVSARWPPIKMNFDTMLQKQANKLVEAQDSSGMSKKRRQPRKSKALSESQQSSLKEVVMQQPLLITIYDYKKDGCHTILGQINTTFLDLEDKAQKPMPLYKTIFAIPD